MLLSAERYESLLYALFTGFHAKNKYKLSQNACNTLSIYHCCSKWFRLILKVASDICVCVRFRCLEEGLRPTIYSDRITQITRSLLCFMFKP